MIGINCQSLESVIASGLNVLFYKESGELLVI